MRPTPDTAISCAVSGTMGHGKQKGRHIFHRDFQK
nr:MAG TPA: hypothetical protein [Caudoviricetes sp.]